MDWKRMKGLLAMGVGLLLCLLKGEVISIVLSIIGILVLVSAFFDWKNQRTNTGIVKLVVGICILLFGWLFVNLALFLLAAVIIIIGLKKIMQIKEQSPVNLSTQDKVVVYAKPVLTVLAGAILLLNQGGVIDWIFMVVGILLIIEGALEFF